MAHRLLGKCIAAGRNAQVFAWGEDCVLKLFADPNSSAQQAEREFRTSQEVFSLGLPCPAPVEIVEEMDRVGIVFSRVSGPSMLRLIAADPGLIESMAQQLAHLQLQMHSKETQSLPSQRTRLREQIERSGLAASLRDQLQGVLADLPDANRLCHGDFHPDNVLISGKGPVIVDWADACAGNPLADVARTSLLLLKGAVPSDGPDAAQLVAARQAFHEAFMGAYFRETKADAAQLANWEVVIMAARLAENIPGERPLLAASIVESLETI